MTFKFLDYVLVCFFSLDLGTIIVFWCCSLQIGGTLSIVVCLVSGR